MAFSRLLSLVDKSKNMVYILAMEYINLKVRRQTAKRLKLLAAFQEDTMMNVVDRLVEAELARLEAERKTGTPDAGHTRVQD
jgi:hypothetical protein